MDIKSVELPCYIFGYNEEDSESSLVVLVSNTEEIQPAIMTLLEKDWDLEDLRIVSKSGTSSITMNTDYKKYYRIIMSGSDQQRYDFESFELAVKSIEMTYESAVNKPIIRKSTISDGYWSIHMDSKQIGCISELKLPTLLDEPVLLVRGS